MLMLRRDPIVPLVVLAQLEHPSDITAIAALHVSIKDCIILAQVGKI
jgi:hypothetical protein